jgi:tetratricopeptide (TPR) repeat protein
MAGMDGGKELQKAYEAILKSDFEQAEDWFERAIAAEPDNAEYHYRFSITCARSNKLPRALQHAEIAAKLDSESDMYRLHLATLQARELMVQAERALDGSLEQPYLAVELLKQAIALDPLSVEALLLLGAAAEAIGDYALAVRSANDVLRLDPQHEAAAALLQQYEQKLSGYLGTNSQSL